MKRKRILIISNRCISETDNNGKTILSIIKNIPKENVAQLYFYSNIPTVEGYNYYQLSDIDILKGKLNKNKRGRQVCATQQPQERDANNLLLQQRFGLRRSALTLFVRDAFWKHSWMSIQLNEWLEEFSPEVVFFVAADCLYAYEISDYIVNKFNCKLITYVTDDYIIPTKNDNWLERYRKSVVKSKLGYSANRSIYFYTISERMRNVYEKELGVNSRIIFNMPDNFRNEAICMLAKKNEKIEFVYAGSLYYGRDESIVEIGKILDEYNLKKTNDKKSARLSIYSNNKLSDTILEKIKRIKSIEYKGALSKAELEIELNKSNVLVFVESLDEEVKHKVQLSFSTKIPEYLSLGKKIFAVGPNGIGSMDYLEGVAVCAHNNQDIEKQLIELLGDYNCDSKDENCIKEYLDLKKMVDNSIESLINL